MTKKVPIIALLFALYFICFINLNINASNVKADSLKALIHNTDASKLPQLLFDIGYVQYYDYQYDSAIVYYAKALKNVNCNPLLKGKVLFSYGEMYLETGDFNLALDNYFRALDIYTSFNNKQELLNCYFGIGLAYKSKGFFKAAKSYYSLSLNLAEELNDSLSMADNYNNIGTVEKNLGNYPQAMVNYNRALKLYEHKNKKVHIFNVLNNIAGVHEKQGDLKKSKQYYEQSLALARETGDRFYLFAPLVNTASLHVELGDYKHSFDLFLEALNLANEIKDNVRVVECYIELGNLYLKQDNVGEAKNYYLKAKETSEANVTKPSLVLALVKLASVTLSESDYLTATNQAESALSVALETEASPLIAEAYKLLYEINTSKGDYKSALTYHQNYIDIQNSIFTLEKTKAIEELEIQYQVQLHIDENQRLVHESINLKKIAKQRKILSLLLGIGVLLSLCVVFLLGKQIINRKEIHKQRVAMLNDKIEYQKRELVSKSILIAEKNNSIERIICQLDKLTNKDESLLTTINSIKRGLKFELRHKKHWKEFETHFNAVHPEFYKRLNNSFANLTLNDRKISAFLKLKLSSKEIAAITGQSLKSIEVARSRLRKKLNLKRDDNLIDVLERI